MVYRGVIVMAKQEGFIWLVALVAAMFGSALTPASFVKVLHSVFLGQPQPEAPQGPKPNVLMGLPMVVLAALCYNVCPPGAMEMEDDVEAGVRRIIIHLDRCIFCGQCHANCLTEKGIEQTNECDLSTTDRSTLREGADKGPPPSDELRRGDKLRVRCPKCRQVTSLMA